MGRLLQASNQAPLPQRLNKTLLRPTSNLGTARLSFASNEPISSWNILGFINSITLLGSQTQLEQFACQRWILMRSPPLKTWCMTLVISPWRSVLVAMVVTKRATRNYFADGALP